MSIFRTSDSSLSKSEVEDREVTRLMPSGRDPHPKKKHRTERRSPRPGQRRRRIKERDSDLNSVDHDLSLSNKHSFDLHKISSRIINSALLDTDESEYFSCVKPLDEYLTKLRSVSVRLKDEYLLDLDRKFGFFGIKQVYDDIKDDTLDINDYSDSVLNSIKKRSDSIKQQVEKDSSLLDSYKIGKQLIRDPGELVRKISKNYIDGTPGLKAAILKSIKKTIASKFRYPESFIKYYSSDPYSGEDLSDLLRDIEKDGKIKIPDAPNKSDLLSFYALSSLYKELLENPLNPDYDKLERKLQGVIDQRIKDFEYMAALNSLMANYNMISDKLLEDIEEEIQDDLDDEQDIELEKTPGLFGFLRDWEKETETVLEGYNEWISEVQSLEESLDNIQNEISKNSPDLWEALAKKYAEFFKKNHPEEIPEILQRYATSQSSNEKYEYSMKKTAEFHGQVYQGNPDGPTNTGWKSIDKRYLNEKHYESIILSAKSMLKDAPWFAYSWDGSATDAPLRAALDLAITTADGSIYQNKIDAPTYEYLLNKLGSWDYDLFSDTSLNIPKSQNKRKASRLSMYDEMMEFASFIK